MGSLTAASGWAGKMRFCETGRRFYLLKDHACGMFPIRCRKCIGRIRCSAAIVQFAPNPASNRAVYASQKFRTVSMTTCSQRVRFMGL